MFMYTRKRLFDFPYRTPTKMNAIYCEPLPSIIFIIFQTWTKELFVAYVWPIYAANQDAFVCIAQVFSFKNKGADFTCFED